MPENPITVTAPPKLGLNALSKQYEDLKAKQVVMNRYMPTIDTINSSAIGNISEPIFANPVDNIYSRFTMLPGSHTVESCAMNAGLISANQQYNNEMDIINHNISVNDGFYLEIYNNYFWDDVRFFDKTSPIYNSFTNNEKSFSTSFADIEQITNGKITFNGGGLFSFYNLYSIRLTGVFKFDTVGKWIFATTSDDSSLIWIGDDAISGLTKDNLDLNNDGGHGMRTRTYEYDCKEVGEKPIRIMMGNWGGPSGLLIQYKFNGWSEFSNTAKYKDKTYIKNYTKNGTLIYNDVYYSLIGDPATKKLNCAIYGKVPIDPKTAGYSSDQGFLQSSISSMDDSYLRSNIGDYHEVVVWEFINPEFKIYHPAGKVYLSNDWVLTMDSPNGIYQMTDTNNNIFLSHIL